MEEQIEILKSKGLIINDYNYAYDVLIRENYFFLSGYRHVFLKSRNDRMFIDGASFEELYAMFNFDRQIRNIFFKNLLIIENNAKSMFAYQLSKKYGIKEKNYLNPANFDCTSDKGRRVNDLLKKIKRQIRVNGGQHTATMHYINNYGYVPLWVVVKVLSFGLISELFTIMKPEDQKEISSMYNVKINNLLSYLPILANFRNLCAHEDIMFEHKTQKEIEETRYHAYLHIEKEDGRYIKGIDDLFAVVIILKQMLREEDFTLLINEISYEFDILEGKLHTITIKKVMERMGFPANFKDIARIDEYGN